MLLRFPVSLYNTMHTLRHAAPPLKYIIACPLPAHRPVPRTPPTLPFILYIERWSKAVFLVVPSPTIRYTAESTLPHDALHLHSSIDFPLPARGPASCTPHLLSFLFFY